MAFVRQNLLSVALTVISGMVGVVLILADGDSPVLVGVGGSLLAAAFVSLLDLVRRFGEDGVDGFRESARLAGLRRIHRSRNVPVYPRLVAKASRIDVSGYSLTGFLAQHGTSVRHRAEQGRLEVRVLLVDPASPASTDQAAQEHGKGSNFALQVGQVRREFSDEQRIHVRFIQTALPTMVFRIDDRLFVGPHFAVPSAQVATLELRKGWMHKQYEDEFERLWKSATPVPVS